MNITTEGKYNYCILLWFFEIFLKKSDEIEVCLHFLGSLSVAVLCYTLSWV